MAVEYGLFGGVEARLDGRRLDLGPARQRCVLAVLLVDANTPVSADQLIDRVWPGSPPARTRVSLQSYISRLRGILAADPLARIDRLAGGYRLTVPPDAVDLHHVRHLIAQARSVDDGHAAELIERALRLWRGEPFAGLDTPWLTTVRAALDRERLAVVLDHADLLLRTGRHADLLPLLSSAAEQHPLDERLIGQLMQALYRGGRQAEALHHYQRTRTRLADELGVDPGAALKALYQRILAADPTLDPAARPPVAAAPTPSRLPIPRQLPAAPWLFTGRVAELAALTARLDADGAAPRTMVISAIGGAGGIGKTWLALHWAHRNAHLFPDGQLYVNLRGFDPGGTPTTPADAVRGFLVGLGVDPIPVDEDARTGLYRSLLADRRMLVVLDNAAGMAQVVPLLPGSPSCTVLVTSRDRLAGLVMAYGALSLQLDVLSDVEARALLAAGVGADRLAAEPDAAAELVRYCAGQPLALSIVAGRAFTNPDFPLSVLAEELRDTNTRLAVLAGDPVVNVRTVLSWSYEALNADQATLFGLLGRAPGADISRPAAAAMAGWTGERTDEALRALERGSLIQRPAPGRYRMHDLIRLYAGEQAAADLPADTRDAALLRLADFYAHTACSADRALSPLRPATELPPPAPGVRPLDLADDKAAALTWLDAEHGNLMAIQRRAADRGWHRPAWLVAWALTTYHHWRGHLTEDVVAWRIGLTGAEGLAEPAALTVAHRRLGYAYAWVDRHADALTHLEQALALAEQAGDHAAQASTHHGLASAWGRRGDDRRARAHATAAMRLFERIGKPAQEAQALTAAAWFAARLGDYEWAMAAAETALGLHRKYDNRFSESDTLYTIGYVHQLTDRSVDALDHYRQALAGFREVGNTQEEADTLYRIGQLEVGFGSPDAARMLWQQALVLYRAHRRTAEVERTERDLAGLD